MLTLVALALRNRPAWSALALVGVVAGAMRWAVAAHEPRAHEPGEGGVLVAEANLFTLNPDRGRAFDQVLRERPDLVALLETSHGDQADFGSIPWLPHQAWDHSNVGVALLSALPFERLEVHSEVKPPFIEATIRVDGQAIEILVCHLPSPLSDRAARARREYVSVVARVLVDHPGPALVVGDLNLAIGDPLWPELRDRCRLSRPLGVEPSTWPASWGPFGMAIDHVLGRDLGIEPPRALALPGSDHRGLLTRVAPTRRRGED